MLILSAGGVAWILSQIASRTMVHSEKKLLMVIEFLKNIFGRAIGKYKDTEGVGKQD